MTDWMTPLAILVAGLIAGTMIIYLFGRRRTIPPDLRAVRDALLEQIRNADGEERLRLELEAAEVLRQMDRVPPAAGRLAVSGSPIFHCRARGQRSWLRGIAAGRAIEVELMMAITCGNAGQEHFKSDRLGLWRDH